MQKTIVHIQSYEEALQLPGVKTQPFLVFRKARQLLRELKKLEKITKEKNELLEVIGLYLLILLLFIYLFILMLSPKTPLFYNHFDH